MFNTRLIIKVVNNACIIVYTVGPYFKQKKTQMHFIFLTLKYNNVRKLIAVQHNNVVVTNIINLFAIVMI